MDAKRQHVEVVDDQTAFVRTAVELITAAAIISIGRRGFFRIALAGGSTPRAVYEALATDRDIDWRRWQLFWGDERTVPPDSEESNYRMVRTALLDRLPVTPGLVIRMAGEAEPDAAAASYADSVRELVPANPRSGAGAWPRFDLILLGMGSDGHTASLFPQTNGLHEVDRPVIANAVPKLATVRLTFTAPLINAARRVLFLVRGADKAAVLDAVLNGPRRPFELPSQMIQPTDGSLTWLVDRDAYTTGADDTGRGRP
jgi:6-phosphogluconolactonase